MRNHAGALVWMLALSGCGGADEPQMGDPEALGSFAGWQAAASLGPVLNTAATDGCPFISKDELTLYFASNRPGGAGGMDLYVARRADRLADFGPPANLAAVNGAANEICPMLSVDGHELFLVSNRPGGCGGQDLYVARRPDASDDQGWGAPEHLGCVVNSAADDFTPSMVGDGAGGALLYFSSTRPGGAGKADIYASARQADGSWGAASNVVELNTEVDDMRPNVRHDGKEIFFDSDRPGSLGATDIWSASRAGASGAWGAPAPLGAEINSAAADGRASVSFDGRSLYFMSGREGGAGGLDLYRSTRDKLNPR